MLERGDERGEFLLDQLAAAGVVDAEGGELRFDVARTDADDRPSTREVVEGLELLGRDERVTVGEHVGVRQEVGALGETGEPRQRGDAVLPVGAHGVGEGFGDRDVVADRDVEEAVVVGGARDPGEVGGTRGELPVGDERPALRLDGELDAVDARSRGDLDHGEKVAAKLTGSQMSDSGSVRP